MDYVFDSARLGFREMVPDDAEALFQMHTTESVMRYIGMPPWNDHQESLEYIFKNLRSYSANGFGRWVVEEKDSGEWLGLAGLLIDQQHGFIDLGYRFNPDHWGKGYATESAMAVIKYGFNALDLPEIQARVAKENLTSIKVLEKCGFECSGDTICMGIKALAYQMDKPGFERFTAQSLPRE